MFNEAFSNGTDEQPGREQVTEHDQRADRTAVGAGGRAEVGYSRGFGRQLDRCSCISS